MLKGETVIVFMNIQSFSSVYTSGLVPIHLNAFRLCKNCFCLSDSVHKVLAQKTILKGDKIYEIAQVTE